MLPCSPERAFPSLRKNNKISHSVQEKRVFVSSPEKKERQNFLTTSTRTVAIGEIILHGKY